VLHAALQFNTALIALPAQSAILVTTPSSSAEAAACLLAATLTAFLATFLSPQASHAAVVPVGTLSIQTTKLNVSPAQQERTLISQLLPATLAARCNTALIVLRAQFATLAAMALLSAEAAVWLFAVIQTACLAPLQLLLASLAAVVPMAMVLTQTTKLNASSAQQEHTLTQPLLPVTLAVRYNTALIVLLALCATLVTTASLSAEAAAFLFAVIPTV